MQYDWALVLASQSAFPATLEPDLELHLKIEMFRNNVSRSLASNTSDPVGLAPIQDRLPMYNLLFRQLESLESFAGLISGKAQVDWSLR
jgi:transcriptional regulatory protein LEU3